MVTLVARFPTSAFQRSSASVAVVMRWRNNNSRESPSEKTMKFICLGYTEEKIWEQMPKIQHDAMVEECLAYDEKLNSGGHWTGEGEALQKSRTAKTLRQKGDKVTVTDGPYAETKEQLGGFGVLEARDLDQAVELMSSHPGLRFGPFEIRPI